jgi:hypothetical protein
LCEEEGGDGGSQIVGGAYFVLRDHMKAHYLNIPQNTSLKDWYKRWFYV